MPSPKDIAGIEAIADLLRSAARDAKHRKIGIEIERIGMWPDCTPFGYEKTRSAEGEVREGAEALLLALSEQYGWPLSNNIAGRPLGLTPDTGNITLEPGSQLELATEATVDLGSLVEKTQTFEAAVDRVSCPWGLRWIGLGTNPCNGPESIDVIPATRYGLMTEYLGKRDTLGLSMMRVSSSVQVNLDYQSEEEGIEMLRVALAAAPLSYALFANSPLYKAKESGYLSFRREIWKHTDPDRTGLLNQAFDKGFNYKTYAEHLWNYPLMYLQNSKKEYVASQGKCLAQIAKGEVPGVEADAANRLNAVRQLFTEARIKPGYVEIRSLDGQRPRERYAAAAFWMGLLYDENARSLVLSELGKMSADSREQLLEASAKEGLAANTCGINLYKLSEKLLDAACLGLQTRGYGEEKFLKPIQENISEGVTPAERVLKIFRETPTKKIPAVIAYAAQNALD
ncbi:MAG: hypothetical protein H6617_03210 [Bdellovibrionaceae bacterium]|nr:hypothetical protein [Pseudobdellovibrionaceae bacterium]